MDSYARLLHTLLTLPVTLSQCALLSVTFQKISTLYMFRRMEALRLHIIAQDISYSRAKTATHSSGEAKLMRGNQSEDKVFNRLRFNVN